MMFIFMMGDFFIGCGEPTRRRRQLACIQARALVVAFAAKFQGSLYTAKFDRPAYNVNRISLPRLPRRRMESTRLLSLITDFEIDRGIITLRYEPCGGIQQG